MDQSHRDVTGMMTRHWISPYFRLVLFSLLMQIYWINLDHRLTKPSSVFLAQPSVCRVGRMGIPEFPHDDLTVNDHKRCSVGGIA